MAWCADHGLTNATDADRRKTKSGSSFRLCSGLHPHGASLTKKSPFGYGDDSTGLTADRDPTISRQSGLSAARAL